MGRVRPLSARPSQSEQTYLYRNTGYIGMRSRLRSKSQSGQGYLPVPDKVFDTPGILDEQLPQPAIKRLLRNTDLARRIRDRHALPLQNFDLTQFR